MAVHRYKVGSAKKEEVAEKPAAKKISKKTTKAPVQSKPAKESKTEKKAGSGRKIFAPFRAIKRYLVGSWNELRQVRWPNRKQTWVLTVAVIVFSLFLGGLIFLLDLGFTFLFKEVVL